MKMNAKTTARAKILAYVLRNGLSTLNEIVSGIEMHRATAHSICKELTEEELIKRLRDDVTNQPGYEITDTGRAWLKKNGKPEAATAPAPEEAKPAAPTGAQAAPAPTPPAPAKPAAKTPAKPAAKAAPAKLPKPKAAAAAVYAAIQDPEQITAPIDPAEQMRQALAENMALSQTIVEICCAIGQDPGKTTTSQLPQLVREHIDHRIGKETYTLLGVLADIRKAIGDDTGKIMLGELAAHIGEERGRLLRDRNDFEEHLRAIIPITKDVMAGFPGEWREADAVRAMGQLIDAQKELILDQDQGIDNQAIQIETQADDLANAARKIADLEQQITELRARVAAQIQAGHETASSANRLLTEVHEVLANGWPISAEAPQGKTTLQLAQAIVADFGRLFGDYLAAELKQPATPDAYLVTRSDDRGVSRHKRQEAAQRKAKAAIRAGAKHADIYAVTRVATATSGPVIKTR